MSLTQKSFSFSNNFPNKQNKPHQRIKYTNKALLIIFMILNIIFPIPIQSKIISDRNMIFNAYKITVKYKGSSSQILYNCGNCDNYPKTNYPSTSNKGTEYYNGIYVNKAELTWNSLDKFVYLFCGCENIIEIDLTEFSTNGIREMTGMFKNCYSLVS